MTRVSQGRGSGHSNARAEAPRLVFTYFAPARVSPKLDDRARAAAHARQTTPTTFHEVAGVAELYEWIAAHADERPEARKGDAGYIVAARVDGARSDSTTGPASFALIDYDGAPPDWEALDHYQGFAWTTASHRRGEHEAWRVAIPFTSPVAHGELECPFRGGFIRNRSQPAFLPSGMGVQWRALAGTALLDPAPLNRRQRRASASVERRRVDGAAIARRAIATPGAFDFSREPDLSAIAACVPPAGLDGDRHLLVRGLGGWLARRGYEPDAIAAAVRCQIPSTNPTERAAQARDAALRARAGLEAPGWSALERWCETYDAGDALHDLERANRDPREPEGFAADVEPWSEWWASYWPRLAARYAPERAQAANDAGADVFAGAASDGSGLRITGSGLPFILQHRTSFWIHGVETYGHEVSTSELIASVARDLSGLIDDESLTRAELDKHWIKPVARVRSSYTARSNTYDSAADELTLAALRWTTLPATYHAHIDRWLRALFVDRYEAAAQWLASLVALDRPAPCLYIAGPHGLGKSLLACGLAGLWCQPEPASMTEAISDFNESIAHCPIVFTDEGFPRDLDFNAFRSMITSHSRRVNAKNLSKMTVEGCARFMIAANNEDVLRYQKTGTLTKADLEAIADRLLVVSLTEGSAASACRKIVDGLDTHAAASHEIAEHVLWLAATVALEATGRMAAKPGGGERILSNVVAGRSAEILTAIRERMATGAMGERGGVHTSSKHPGEVWINTTRLCEALHGRVALAAIKECCEAFELRAGGVQRKTADGHVLRWRVLDGAKLTEAFARLD